MGLIRRGLVGSPLKSWGSLSQKALLSSRTSHPEAAPRIRAPRCTGQGDRRPKRTWTLLGGSGGDQNHCGRGRGSPWGRKWGKSGGGMVDRCPGSTFINLSPTLDAGPSSMWSVQASVGALWPSVSPAVVMPHLPLGRPRAARSPSRTAGNV